MIKGDKMNKSIEVPNIAEVLKWCAFAELKLPFALGNRAVTFPILIRYGRADTVRRTHPSYDTSPSISAHGTDLSGWDGFASPGSALAAE